MADNMAALEREWARRYRDTVRIMDDALNACHVHIVTQHADHECDELEQIVVDARNAARDAIAQCEETE